MDVPDPNPTASQFFDGQHHFAAISMRIRRARQIFIALLHGAAVGGGMALALACDIRVASKDVRMNAAMLNLGLGGADLALSYLLPRLVSQSIAMQLLVTGEYLTAERAHQLGLVASVVAESAQLDAAADHYLQLRSRVSPMGLRMTKQVVHLSMDAPSMDTVIGLEDRNQTVMIRTEDSQEALAAFFDGKRVPNYGNK
jgi:enoyl-CoA hydratase/carnithine racemase